MISDIKQFLGKYGFQPNHLLGQNFLLNQLTLEKIVEAAEIKKTDQVLEIGSGIGNLTQLIAEQAEFVLAVEKDDRYFPILKDQLGVHLKSHTKTPKSESNVELIFDDVMRFNFQELLKPGYKVVANIPYYITGKIVEMLLVAKNKPSRIVLLMQKEVAERIVAPVGELSILAISVQLFAEPKIIGIVPKTDFYPVPKVDSAILVLDILEKPRYQVDQKEFFKIIKAAFSGKRKQIHNTLKNNLKLDPEVVSELLKSAKVDPKMRPQELSLEQWHQLYKSLDKTI
ncbi:MAG: rRNA (adenine1518-N6/adenine1519-N6)-dimethyltransferase [Candidatus Doudnabacteria bacterium]|nr:rRNA (adenine1518-N6/adenine1519-N6)-dimethyltransferase [Candidatus Doudnabacteria bacterium]